MRTREQLYRVIRPALGPALAALVGLAWFWRFDPSGRSITGDGALFAHFGRRILDGDVPYRDFFDQKTPLVSYFNALTMGLGRVAGKSELTTMRAGYVLAAAVMVGILFLLATELRTRWLGAVLGVAALLSYERVGAWVAAGSSPKLLMVLAGCAGWLLAVRGRWVLAGVFSATAFLAWQPGLIYLVVVNVLAFRRPGAPSRRRRFLCANAGFGVVVIATVGFFTAVGALGDVYRDTVVFNLFYVGQGATPPIQAIPSLFSRSNAIFGSSWPALALAIAGVVAVPVVWHRARDRDRRAFVESLAMYFALASTFLLVSGGGESDLIMLLPLLALMPAALMAAIAEVLGTHPPRALVARGIAGAGLLAVVAAGSIADSEPGYNIHLQERAATRLARMAMLQRGDQVVSMGAFAFAALTSFPDPVKYLYTYSGLPRFVVEHEHGGVAYYVRLVSRTRPKLILYRHVSTLPRFNKWLARNYRRCRNTAALRALESSAVTATNRTEIWVLPGIARRSTSCRPAAVVRRPRHSPRQAMLVSRS